MSFGTIPADRPVTGRDLDLVRLQNGLLTADACWLFGLSITRWMHIVRQQPDLPISDTALAMLVRLYDQQPGLIPIPKAPTAEELFSLLSKVRGELSQREFGALMGSDASAAYRWLKKGAPASGYAERLMTGLKNLLLSVPEHKRAEVLEEWAQCVTAESKARGVERGAMIEGRWNNADTATKRVKKIVDGETGAGVKKKGLAAKKAASSEK